jgi:dipeptidyl aminopeptidase/acylaminoacyl peptidase
VTTPYGAWTSPFTSDYLVSTEIRLDNPVAVDPDVYWQEGRPTEGGRVAVVRRTPDGAVQDVTPAPFNARTRAHEYGGGAVAYAPDGTVYASNFGDQLVYRFAPGEPGEPLTHTDGMRYADGEIDTARDRLVCVREDHTGPGEAVNTIVAVDLASGAETVLATGHDFYAAPRMSADGRLAYLGWDHPNMPWDGCVLYVADADGSAAVAVAGGPQESITQPTWAPDGTLYFTSDRSGFWNLHRFEGGAVSVVCVRDAEFGVPAWVFGTSTFALTEDGRLVAAYSEAGAWRLASIDRTTGELTPIDTPYTYFSDLAPFGRRVLAVVASPTRTEAIVAIDPATGEVEVLRRDRPDELDPRYISVAVPIEFPTEDGLTAFGFFYPPYNADHVGPEGETPPLLVFTHGGPTSAVDAVLSLKVQFWTSRGFAVLDVNYGGSTGFGRPYRQRLVERWGIVDVDDCVNGARHLAAAGRVDPARLAIRGGSAGGFTTLAALAFRDVFAAGASHFGVGDLAGLATETHKFESRYLDSLVGPYPAERARYEKRSPVHHVDGFDRPVIFFQGLDDKVVPPDQAESMVSALDRKGIPVAYLAYEGEGHGFRQAANIRRTQDAELYFYARIFGFTPAGEVEPVEIRNL